MAKTDQTEKFPLSYCLLVIRSENNRCFMVLHLLQKNNTM